MNVTAHFVRTAFVQELRDCMLGSVANSSLMQLLEESPHKQELLHNFCWAFMKKYSQDEVDEMQDVLDIVAETCSCMRDVFGALLVLLNPEPGICGTDISLVSKLLEYSDTSMKGKPIKMVKLMCSVSAGISDNAFWQRKVDDVLKKGAASLRLAPDLRKLTADMQAEAETQSTSLTDVFRCCVQQLPSLRQELRSGATDALEKLLASRLQKLGHWTLQQTDPVVA